MRSYALRRSSLTNVFGDLLGDEIRELKEGKTF
jgi:hypothetical protein